MVYISRTAMPTSQDRSCHSECVPFDSRTPGGWGHDVMLHGVLSHSVGRTRRATPETASGTEGAGGHGPIDNIRSPRSAGQASQFGLTSTTARERGPAAPVIGWVARLGTHVTGGQLR